MALVPLGVVTVTSTVPAPPTGETAVSWVNELTVKLVAALEPKSTALAPVKPVPVTMTELATDTGPETGLTPLTVGAAS